jgi:outer membrane protein OmpA-like peptidoglycan-associated protein
MKLRRSGSAVILASVLVAGLAWAPCAAADEHVKGVIQSLGSDGTVTMRTDDATDVTIVLRDYTKVRRVDGMRQLKVTSAALIPGLRVRASGYYEAADRFAADRVTYTRSDMKMAAAIRGGVDPTDLRSLDNQRRIGENSRTIAQQQQTLQRQAAEIANNATRIRANEEKIVATTGTLNSRIASLDNYNVVSTVTVYFRNGQARIDPKYRSQLQQLAAQAKGVPGYMIQVQGYASAVGSNALNQRLSMQRADAVTSALQQDGVPPPNIVVPAAMGTKDQVATNKTAKGQAENRRTVVTLLQNKGISER